MVSLAPAAVFLVIGTSAAVYPAAGLAGLAAQAGAPVIEINPEDTALSSLAAVRLRQPAGTALPRLLDLAGLSPA